MTSAPEDRSRAKLLGRVTAFETTLIAGGLILFLVLLYEMLAFLSPPIVAIAALILLWPIRQHHVVRALLLSGGFVMAFWLLDSLSAVLLPFAVVYLFAYLFDPAVVYLYEKYRIPRWVSALLATALVVGLTVLFVLLIVPTLVSQIEVLAVRLIDGIGLLRQWIVTTTVLDNLEATGLIDKHQIVAQLSDYAQEQTAALARGIPDAVQQVWLSMGSLLGLIMSLSIIPVALFYTLKDYPFIRRRLVELFPTFAGRRDYLTNAGVIVGKFLRGQLLISAIAAFNVSVVLLLFNIPFALLIGLMAGFLNMVPNLGVIITNIVAILLMVIFGDPWFVDTIIVVVVLLLQGLLEGAVLQPNILGHQVGLHPVLILLSLFVFGYFMGIIGFFIAVPATAILMTVYKTYRDQLNLELGTGAVPEDGGA